MDTVLFFGNRPFPEWINIETGSIYWRINQIQVLNFCWKPSDMLMNDWFEKMLVFRIHHGGHEDITDHMKTRRHKSAPKHQHPTWTVGSDVKKTVSKDDDLINTSTEDRFIDNSAACDFHLNQVATLHWIAHFNCELCNQDSCTHIKS